MENKVTVKDQLHKILRKREVHRKVKAASYDLLMLF